jgi:hypothetical protein
LLAGCSSGGGEIDRERSPDASIEQALTRARAYAARHDIDLSEDFIQRVVALHDIHDPSKSGWRITFAPRDAGTLDGETSIVVYDNGTISSDQDE